MVTEDGERYLRCILLIARGAAFVLKEILLLEVANGGIAMSELLLNTRKLLKNLTDSQFIYLYPSEGRVNTDLDTWDISLLCAVIETAFGKNLSAQQHIDIKSIRDSRSKIKLHSAYMLMSVNEFEIYTKTLSTALKNLAESLPRKIQNRCHELIREAKSGELEINSSEGHLKEFQTELPLKQDVKEWLDQNPLCQAVGKENASSSGFGEDFDHVSEYSDIYDNAPEDYIIQNIMEVQTEYNQSIASQTINRDEIRGRVRTFLHKKQNISNHEELTNVFMTLIIGDRGQTDSSACDLKETLNSSGTADWMLFVLSGNKKIAKRLLRMGKLPGQSTLNEMSLKFGKKSKITLYTCKAICEYIKSKHTKIIDVWAAYKVENPDKICFVVSLQDNVESIEGSELEKQKINPIRLNKIIEYTFVKRIVGEYSNEGADIITNNITSFDHLDDNAYFKLQECVAKYSVELINDHKYLSVVSACNKRSRDYGFPSWKLDKQDCIVLYVHTKHYIPINEEPFKELYGGIPVDVREGVFTPFGRTAKDFLEHLQMGCQIRGEIKNGQYRQGTLGCFLDHPQYGVCGMTCAHVLLEPWNFIQLKTLYNGSLNWPLYNMCNKVYQPADRGTNVGHTVKVVYKEGSDRASGIDVALFKITSRLPKNSDFPEPSVTGSATLRNIDYEHWRVCSENRINPKMKDVVKFGANTEMSAGQIVFGTTSVQELNSYPLVSGYFAIKLHKQIEVRSADPSFKFADGGDSGALVFTVGESSSEHTCIGIVEGGTSYGTVVVTPILPILEEFNVPCLKNFDAEKALSEIHGKLEYVGSHVLTIRNEVQAVSGEVQKVRNNIGTDMQKLNTDIHTVAGGVQKVDGKVESGMTQLNSKIDLLVNSLIAQQNTPNT